MAYLPENEVTTRTLLRQVLEMQPLSSPVQSTTRPGKRSLSSSRNHLQNLHDTLLSKRPVKQTKTTPVQPKDTEDSGRLFVEHYDFMKEGTPRILLKKILQTASEASVLVPSLVNSQEPEPVELQEESKWNSLDLQLPEPESFVTVAPGLLVRNRRKHRLRVSEFEKEVDQGLAVPSDLTGEQPTSANKSYVTRSFNLTLAAVMPPESVERPGLARRPQNRKKVNVEAFEQGLKDVLLTRLLPDHQSPTPVDKGKSSRGSLSSRGFRRSLTQDQELRDVTQRSNQKVDKGPGRPTKSWTKSPRQNIPLFASSRSTERQTRSGTGSPSQNRCLSIDSIPSRSSISREVRVGSVVAQEQAESVMDEEAEESEDDEETPQRTGSEHGSKTPEFLRVKRRRSFTRPTASVPPNIDTVLSPPKMTRAKRVPKHCAPGPRQARDPDKAGLKHYCRVFSYYTKMPMEKSASEALMNCFNQYFRTLCDDLETYAHHAGRKTVLLADLELLLRRQGLVTDDVSLHVLVERHLPLEYRRLLIPCAASGNSVFPAG